VSRVICVDFDGTIVMHEFPRIGPPVPYALEVMQKLIDHGDKLILFTMRADVYLGEAVVYLKQNKITLYGVNENPTQKEWTASPKAYGQIYIDDAALGCPLVHGKHERPYVDWYKVNDMLFGTEL